MEQKRQNKQKRRAAFTLAEFLTVIAIVGILASLSFVAVIHYQRKLRRLYSWNKDVPKLATGYGYGAECHLYQPLSAFRERNEKNH